MHIFIYLITFAVFVFTAIIALAQEAGVSLGRTSAAVAARLPVGCSSCQSHSSSHGNKQINNINHEAKDSI